jgi:hypothetical protein
MLDLEAIAKLKDLVVQVDVFKVRAQLRAYHTYVPSSHLERRFSV